MRPQRILALLCVCALALLAAPTLATAADPITDCSSQGQLQHTFTVRELRHALATMRANVKEYTDCYDVINRALLADVGGLHGKDANSGSGGSFLPTPVIVVLVVLLLAAATLGAIALRRRRPPPGGDAPPSGGDAPPAA